MVRIVVSASVGLMLCALQSGCCCCRLPMFAGRPIVINPPPIVVAKPPIVIEPPKDVGGPKDVGIPKDVGGMKDLAPPNDKDKLKNDDNPPVGGPVETAIGAVQKLGGSVKRDDALPDRPVVEVAFNFTKATDGDLKNLALFTRLRKLVLTQDPSITGAGLKDLAGLQSLEHLDAGFSPISDEGARNIAAFRNLKFLKVSGAKLTDAGIRDIATLDLLEELSADGMLLNGPAQNEPRDVALKELGKLKQLRKLDLSNTQTGDESARAFAGLTQLKVFQAHGTRITDAGMMELARLKLEELRIGYDISDVGVNALAGQAPLQVLSLFNNARVTDGSVKTLSGLTGLRQLDLNKTKISAKGKAEIRKSLPGCKVKN